MRLVINTTANGIYKSLAAAIFGIAYSLGVVSSGIAFVPLSIARPILRIIQRKSDAGAADVEISASTADPIDVADSTGDLPHVEVAVPAEIPGGPPAELTNEPPKTEEGGSDSNGIAATSGSVRPSFLEMVQRGMSAIRQAVLQLHRLTVTLSMEEGVIQIVVFRGRQVVGWDRFMLTPESGNSGEEPESLSDSARFRKVLTALNIRRARLVADLPLFTPLERQFHLPQASRSYVQPMVIAEVLDTIPFSRDEVEIAWHSQHVRDGYEVVAVAAPRSTVDNQVRFAREAGLTPRGTYSKASALALASRVPNAILIHNQPSETGIVLVRAGSPIVVHHLDTPDPNSLPQDRADALAVAVDQVLGFYQTLVPGADDVGLPVVMTGLVGEIGEYEEILQRTLGRQVLTCPAPSRAPDGFPASEYAANLGLLLADKAGGKPRGQGPLRMGPTPNLLPERHLAQGLPAQAFLIFVVLILMGAAINPTTVQVEALVQQADDLTAALVPLRNEVRERRTDVGLESDAKKELEDVNQQIAALEARVEDLDKDMATLLSRLESITETSLPSGVRLASLAPGKGGFALNGNADSHGGILQYAANLRSSDLFSNATIEEITGSTRESSDGDLRFRILATVTVNEVTVEVDPNGAPASP